jgi:hypothetical protein
MMSLDRYFIFSSYAMFVTGYVMLASTGQLDILSLGLFAIVLGAGWLIDTERVSWSVGHRSANWLIAGGLTFVIAEWYALGVSPVTVTLHFVFFAAALKLLRRKAARRDILPGADDCWNDGFNDFPLPGRHLSVRRHLGFHRIRDEAFGVGFRRQ